MPQMYHMIYRVRPQFGHQDYGRAGGAYVNCFVHTELAATAEWKAAEYLKENHCLIINLEEAATQTTRDTYQNQDYLNAYDEALKEGDAYIFNLWPISIIEKLRMMVNRLLGKK